MKLLTQIVWLVAVMTFPPISSFYAKKTDLIGYLPVEVPAKSDRILSAALHRPPVFVGTVAAIYDSDTITLDGGGFTAGEFANSCYVLFTNGAREGLWAEVTANGSEQIDLAFTTQGLGDAPGDRVEVGNSVKIIPFWTSATLIPEASVPAGTELLVFPRNVEGINLSAVKTSRLVRGSGWYDGPDETNDAFIYPDESVVLRNNSNTLFKIAQIGHVPMAAFRTVISAVAQGVAQDIRLATGLPVSVAIVDLIDPGAAAEGDQILVFDLNQPGINKAPLFTATYSAGFGWLDGETAVNDYQLEKGQGFIYRKAGANNSELLIDHKPSYQE